MKRLVILAAVVVLASGVALSAVGQQGKGKGKGQNNTAEDYTLEWSMVADYNGNQGPDWGEKITFKVWTSETTQPHVQLVCFQDGDVVYGALWPLTSVLTCPLAPGHRVPRSAPHGWITSRVSVPTTLVRFSSTWVARYALPWRSLRSSFDRAANSLLHGQTKGPGSSGASRPQKLVLQAATLRDRSEVDDRETRRLTMRRIRNPGISAVPFHLPGDDRRCEHLNRGKRIAAVACASGHGEIQIRDRDRFSRSQNRPGTVAAGVRVNFSDPLSLVAEPAVTYPCRSAASCP